VSCCCSAAQRLQLPLPESTSPRLSARCAAATTSHTIHPLLSYVRVDLGLLIAGLGVALLAPAVRSALARKRGDRKET